jgi:hypothetical protein
MPYDKLTTGSAVRHAERVGWLADCARRAVWNISEANGAPSSQISSEAAEASFRAADIGRTDALTAAEVLPLLPLLPLLPVLPLLPGSESPPPGPPGPPPRPPPALPWPPPWP